MAHSELQSMQDATHSVPLKCTQCYVTCMLLYNVCMYICQHCTEGLLQRCMFTLPTANQETVKKSILKPQFCDH